MKIAHIKKNNLSTQSVEDHLLETAKLSDSFANKFGFSDWGYIAGVLHDIGKYSEDFQKKMKQILESGDSKIRVDHSTYGAQKCISLYPKIGKILSYCIAGHHAGLPDGSGSETSLEKRLKKQIPEISDVPDEIFASKNIDATMLKKWFEDDAKKNSDRYAFGISFFIRMMYSCLVDADYLNTESFMAPDRFEKRKAYPGMQELLEKFEESLKSFREKKKGQKLPIYDIRDRILNECIIASDSDPGLFSLTVPTGGGKTLSSMAFALNHAVKHDLERIIYVIPYTSIIEQNAAVFREFLGDDTVIEHHSNYLQKEDVNEDDDPNLLAAENWDAPIIVTTNVQFFESLFADRASRARKLHNIAKSVIILDEAQMIPADFLVPCIEVLRELTRHYNTTAVLCTATQPALDARESFPGLENIREIISNPGELSESLRRVREEFIGECDIPELAGKLCSERQVLCIVNSRREARELYQALCDKNDDTKGNYHLSALMCPEHRSRVLDEIRSTLAKNEECRVVSTQLVEAGVDLDFPVVYRSLAGIDSIAQAAGRCNRERKQEFGRVFVFKPSAGIPAIADFRPRAEEAESIFRRSPSDFLSLDAVRSFFEAYFWRKGEKLDKHEIMRDLMQGRKDFNFPFRSLARKFKIIADVQTPVIVPYDSKAIDLIGELRNYLSTKVLRRLHRYTVQVPDKIIREMSESGFLELLHGEIWAVHESCKSQIYSEVLGLYQASPVFLKAEQTVF
jgi:CRISPR-associated endonuclease/helicase Cas3